MMNYGYYQPFGFLGPIFMIFWWIVIVVAIVALVRYLKGGKGHNMMQHMMGGEKSALDILKERFAKGEIDEKEYQEKKKILTES